MSNTILTDDSLEDVPYIMGIDEAGRGPVLGSMVYGASWCPVSKNSELNKLGFADSKVLTEEQRENLFNVIKNSDFIKYAVDIITPETLSGKMLSKRKINLNTISHDSAIGLISLASKSVNIEHVYLDTVGDPLQYQMKLEAIFPNIKITVSKKADSLFPIVSAASICAKVTRDHSLTDWTFKEGITDKSYGSGYPGDERTKIWLESNCNNIFGFPSLVRFSWETCKKILKEKCVKVNWGEESEEVEEGSASTAKQVKLGMYFGTNNSKIKQNDRANYFKTMNLHIVEKGF